MRMPLPTAIVSLRERRDSSFYVQPLVRFWRRLLAFFQGYTLGPNEIVTSVDAIKLAASRGAKGGANGR